MRLYYNDDKFDVDVELDEEECAPEEFLNNFGLGVAAIIIRGMLDTIPNKEEHPFFGKLVLEEIQSNLNDWYSGVFESF